MDEEIRRAERSRDAGRAERLRRRVEPAERVTTRARERS